MKKIIVGLILCIYPVIAVAINRNRVHLHHTDFETFPVFKTFPIETLYTLSRVKKPLYLNFIEELRFDDNIYEKAKPLVNSLIFYNGIGAYIETVIPRTSLGLCMGGYLGYKAYQKYPIHNNGFVANINIRLENKNIFILEEFAHSTDPYSTELENRVENTLNKVNLSLRSSPYNTLGIGFIVNNETQHYFEKVWDPLSHNTIDTGLRTYYNYTPNTNFFFEYLYSHSYYYYDFNHNTNNFSVGVMGELSSKVIGNIKASYISQNEEKTNPRIEDSVGIFGYFLEIKWEPTTQNFISINGQRHLAKSIFGINNYYISTSANFSLWQKIYEKSSISLACDYVLMDYDFNEFRDEHRHDNMFKYIISVERQIRRLNIEFSYEFTIRKSTEPDFNYSRNKLKCLLRWFI